MEMEATEDFMLTIKSEPESDEDSDSKYDMEEVVQVQNQKRKGKTERARKYRASMTEEQREKVREKNKLYQRERRNAMRQALRASMTEEERATQKVILDKKSAERARQYRAAMTEEQREKEKEKDRLRQRKRRSAPMTEEQRAAEREKVRLQRQRLKENEEWLRKERERKRNQFKNETPEQRKARLELKAKKAREKIANMSEDEKFRFEMKRYLNSRARRDNMSEEEREEWLRKNRENVYNYIKNLPPEKKEEYNRKNRLRAKQYFEKNRHKPEIREKFKAYLRQRVANETPVERQKRLYKYKVNTAQRKLRKQLEEEGNLSKEEIDERVKELGKQMWSIPLPPLTEQELSQYKPRPSGRKPKSGRVLPPVPAEPPTKPSKRKLPPIPSLWPAPKTSVIEPDPDESEHATTAPSPQIIPPKEPEFSNSLSGKSEHNPSSPVEDLEDHYSADDDYHYPNDNDEVGSVTGSPLGNEQSSYPDDFGEAEEVTASPWKCPSCTETLNSLYSLRIHFKRTHIKSVDQFKFLCMCCPWKTNEPNENLRFKSRKELHQHVRNQHSQKFWPCPSCNLLLYSETRYNNHITTCAKALKVKANPKGSPKGEFQCDQCGKSFKTYRAYRFHRDQSHHPDKNQFICPHCKRSCKFTRTFWVHFVLCAKLIPEVRVSDQPVERSRLKHGESKKSKKYYYGEGPVPCELCGKTFSQQATLDDHIRRDHEGMKDLCSECGRNFQSAGKLWRHQAEVHNMTDLPPPPGVQVLRCKYCNDFVMRGYEHHVKKKHPENLQDFRTNELPVVKEKLKQIQILNPKRKFKNRADDYNCVQNKDYIKFKKPGGKIVAQCLICKNNVNHCNIKRHMRLVHSSVAKNPSVEIKCTKCDKLFGNRENFQRHFAEMHAYEGIDEKLVKNKLIAHRFIENSEGQRKRVAVCRLCNVDIPGLKLSKRCHFVAWHFELMQEMMQNGDTTEPVHL